ncbi:hypothetical protein HHI36_003455 [Cryptolaemus montrouzieri]|uniref:Solute carrier family 46 member 3 n=1 Tax=Cryptolaemus montrouzieri TaxID=559131 RepID=A0ABD2PDG8_9CUCU
MFQSDVKKSIDFEFVSEPEAKDAVRRKITHLFSRITVEPIVFLYIAAMMMNNLVTQNLALEKACRVNLHFNKSICDALVSRNRSGYLPHQEVEAQQLVVKWAGYKAFFIGSLPVVMIIFLGSWSDRHHRRKPIIIIPMFGDLIASIGLFLCSYFFLELSIEYSWMVETFTFALFGGQWSLLLAVYSFVGGISSNEDRTVRVGIVAIVYTVAISTGMFFSGIVLNTLGFLGAYCFTASLLIIAIVYGIYMIKEERVEKKEDEKKGFLKDLIALEHVTNTFKVCFAKSEGNRRARMLANMFLCAMIIGAWQGEYTIQYMYLRFRCGWNEVDFSIFNAITFIIQILGNFFALSYFTKYLKWDDAILGIIGIVSKVSASIMYAFAPSGLYFYVGAVFEMFYGTIFIAMRALMAKVVHSHELGQSNSLFGICEALMPFVFGPLYSKIYIVTLTAFPGTFYLFSVGLYAIGFCLFLYLYRSENKESKLKFEERKVTKNEEIFSRRN